MTASSSASWTRFSPPSNFVNGHVLTMWFMVCRWPQSQLSETPFVQVSMTWALTCPETVHQRPCMMRIVGSVTIVWLSTEADDQSSLHCIIVSTNVMSGHIGHRDASHGGGCSKTSAYTGQFGWASMIWSILSVAALWCREGGANCWALAAMRAVRVAGSLKSGTLHCEVGCWWDLCSWI